MNLKSWDSLMKDHPNYIHQTELWTRSKTILEGLNKLNFFHHGNFQTYCEKKITKKEMGIYIVGAETKEGNSVHETTHIFQPLIQVLSKDTELEYVHLILIGPNIHPSLHEKSFVDAYKNQQLDSFIQQEKSFVVDIHYFGDTWDHYTSSNMYQRADVAICFNAGVWGYDQWIPTIKNILLKSNIPVIITSYNEYEASDDEDILEENGCVFGWRPERNPFGSLLVRTSSTYESRLLNDNGYWQCVVPA